MIAEAAMGAPPPPPPMLAAIPTLPPIPGVPNPTPGQEIDLTRYTAEQIASLYESGYLERDTNRIAENPQFKPSLLNPVLLAEGVKEAASLEDVHGQSDLFKNTGGWRRRGNDRADAAEDENGGGDFAQGLDADESTAPLLQRKRTLVVEDGMFGSDDVKGGEDEGKTKLPGGLFDNSDDEAEIMASKMEEKKAAAAVEKKKNVGMFDLDDEEDEDYAARASSKIAEAAKKKQTALLEDSEEDEEFKPTVRVSAPKPVPP